MIDAMLALGLIAGILTAIGLVIMLVFGVVLLSIIIEDTIRCMFLGGNGEEGSDWRKNRRDKIDNDESY